MNKALPWLGLAGIAAVLGLLLYALFKPDPVAAEIAAIQAGPDYPAALRAISARRWPKPWRYAGAYVAADAVQLDFYPAPDFWTGQPRGGVKAALCPSADEAQFWEAVKDGHVQVNVETAPKLQVTCR